MRVIALIVIELVVLLALLIGWVTQPLTVRVSQIQSPAVNEAELRRDVEQLSGGAVYRHSNNYRSLTQARDYIVTRFNEAKIPTRLQSFEVDGEIYSNVIARFGPDHGAPLVIGAHYDSEEDTPGADDNASGVAGLLELGRILAQHPPTVPVELVAYTLEESPFFRSEEMGSRHHAANLVSNGVKPRLVLVLEMIGYFDDSPDSQNFPIPLLKWFYPTRGNFIAVIGRFLDTSETRLVKTVLASYSNLPVSSFNAPASVVGVDFSDHASYWQYDIPAVMVTDTAFYRNPHYHKITDKADTLDYRRMAQVVKGLYGIVKYLEKEDSK